MGVGRFSHVVNTRPSRGTAVPTPDALVSRGEE
jgi:hypothetical protein